MTTHPDSTRHVNPAASPGPVPPVVAPWTYPVRPAWIHDLLDLWERNKPLVQLLELATDRVAQDIPLPNVRRRTLYQVARYFVPVTGQGPRGRTASPNPWAAFSQLFPAHPLAPAYLVHIVARNEMAGAIAALLHRAYAIGDVVELSDVRKHLIARFGDRPNARAGANSLLRTLAHFGVLAAEERAGMYRYGGRLPVGAEPFPLLIWTWWRARQTNVIRIAGLADDPLLTFVEPASYAEHWAAYDGTLWTLETREGIECAVLRHPDNPAFIRTMFNLLSSHPKWPTVNRQFPEP